MKKLVRGIALLLIPAMIYLAVFISFEPNNYFGIFGETPSGTIFGALREFRREPSASVIIGDSRLASMDMERAEQITGRHFSNLSFGGAGLGEMLDLLEWLLDNYPQVNEVIFGLSFYTLNEKYGLNRFSYIETAMLNPFAYVTNLSYALQAMQNFGIALSGGVLGGGKSETRDPATYATAQYTDPVTGESFTIREDIAEYLRDISRYTQQWAPNTQQFGRLLALISRCEKNGIRFVVVLPPAHEAVYVHEIQNRGIGTQMLPLLTALSLSEADLVLDYEIGRRPELSDDQFYDGLHLDYLRGIPYFTDILFSAIR